MKKLKLSFVLSILFITACSSTPKQGSADMEGVNVSQVTREEFESIHGCFDIKSHPKKNELTILTCHGLKDVFKYSLSLGLAPDSIEKFEDAVFIDVFNEFKVSNEYLSGCFATDLIKKRFPTDAGVPAIEVIYMCEED